MHLLKKVLIANATARLPYVNRGGLFEFFILRALLFWLAPLNSNEYPWFRTNNLTIKLKYKTKYKDN